MQGTVADLSWAGDDTPFLLSCSSDMNVTLWSLDGGKVGDFGKDEWALGDETTWISRGAEQRVANPNDGVVDRGGFAKQLRTILSPVQRSPSTSPNRTRPPSGYMPPPATHTHVLAPKNKLLEKLHEPCKHPVGSSLFSCC